MTATVAEVKPEPSESTLRTLRRGLALSPELRTGLVATMALGVLVTAGRTAVPVAIQQGIDGGLRVTGGPNLGVVVIVAAVALTALVLTVGGAFLMNVRLYRVSEGALAGVRTRTFRHLHGLSMLHLQAERRGSLLARVTNDVDQISQFLQWGGFTLMMSAFQVSVATVVMALYSWKLTVVVWIAFAPLALVVTAYQRRLADAYAAVRRNVGAMLSVVGESVVGAQVIRAYGVQERTERRLDEAIERTRAAQLSAVRPSVFTFAVAETVAGVATALVVVAGVFLGIDRQLTVGQLTAFLLLLTFFVLPIQIATEMINESQNAIAGWRRVLAIQDVEPDLTDPGADGVDLPPGAIEVALSNVSFTYPNGRTALIDLDLSIAAGRRVAVVGETGGGKTTLAKLLARLMDPTRGIVSLSGVPLPQVRLPALRQRVTLVPQDGFLFRGTISDNVRVARPELSDEGVTRAFADIGLADWLALLPDGLSAQVGEGGQALSVGERQLVALVRAYVRDPDLLILDEATSAVDPATDVRLRMAFDALTRGRTTVVIAHRISTAQAADDVVVMDGGRVVQRGSHDELLHASGSVYARLYRSWLEQTR